MSKKAEPRLCDPASWLLLATGRVLAAFVLLDMSVCVPKFFGSARSTSYQRILGRRVYSGSISGNDFHATCIGLENSDWLLENGSLSHHTWPRRPSILLRRILPLMLTRGLKAWMDKGYTKNAAPLCASLCLACSAGSYSVGRKEVAVLMVFWDCL